MAGLDAVIGGLQVECCVCLPFHVVYQVNEIRKMRVCIVYLVCAYVAFRVEINFRVMVTTSFPP